MSLKANYLISATITGEGYTLKTVDMTMDEFVAVVRKLTDGAVSNVSIETEWEDDWGL